MNLIKTSLLNAIAVVIKMLTLFGINKVLAVYVGPSGYAVIGQFQNAVQMMTTLGAGAINTGVTKYTAEYHYDQDSQYKVWRTAGTVSVLCSAIMAVFIALFNKELASYFIGDVKYGRVFVCFALAIVFFALNTLFLAVLNGKKEILYYVFANIAGSLCSALVTSILSIYYGLYGALVALSIYQSVSFFATLAICYKVPWFKIGLFWGGVDKVILIKLSKYVAMALVSAICVPISHILIRHHMIDVFGADYAGYWEAMWRLSSAYLMLVTSTLAVYFLPRLSELKKGADIQREIISGYKLILPLTACCGVFIFLFRDFIIALLFTPDFSPMRDLFAWQMFGDSLKIGAWMLAYVMLGQAMVKPFIIAEVLSTALFVLLTYVFTHMYGFEGVAVAHAVNYLLYGVGLSLVLRKYLFLEKTAA